nr:unnamed protein product [Callosobruchus analis]
MDEQVFLTELRSYLEQMATSFSHIVLGDMNIKLNSEDDIAYNYLNLMSEYNFLSMINKPTRVFHETRNYLAHIFMKSNNANVGRDCVSVVFDSCITDQRATVLDFPINIKVKKINRSNIKRKEWITTGIVNSVNEKNRLYSEYVNNSHDIQKKQNYISYQKKLDKSIKGRMNFIFMRDKLRVLCNGGSPIRLDHNKKGPRRGLNEKRPHAGTDVVI